MPIQLITSVIDRWFLIYNSELNFKEFCIGTKENNSIIDEDVFADFMKDIESE